MHIFYLVNSKQSDNNSSNNNKIIKDDRKQFLADQNNQNYNTSNQHNNNQINNSDSSSSSGSNSDNNDGNKVIDQFPHQVGGHSAMLSIEGNICKPLISRELQFYQFTEQKDNIHSFFISPFLAKFYGVIEVLKSKNESPDTSISNNSNHNNINKDYNHNSIVNNKNNKKQKDCKHPSGTQQRYIVLEDLTKNYKKPCIVDIKVGTRQRGAICSTTTSTTLGIRVCGMKIFNSEIGNIVFDRYYGRTLNTETLEDSLFNFFTGSNINNFDKQFNIERIKLLDSIIEKLSQIECIISNKNEKFPFKIYSSSLLIIYEGSEDNSIDQCNSINSNTNCIDINMSQLNESNSSSCITTPSQSPTTSLLNISNQSSNNININNNNSKIQDNINKILRSNSTSSNSSISSSSSSNFGNSGDIFKSMDDSSDFGVDEDIDESFLSSSDMDSDIDETLSNSSHSNNIIQKLQSPLSDINCLKNDVKMIDFAHAIPINEQDALEDDGYLFGVQNLQLLLFKVKSRILFNHNNINNNNLSNNSINNNDTLDSSSLSQTSSSSVASSASSNNDFSFLKLYQKELNNLNNNIIINNNKNIINNSSNNNNTFIPTFY